MTLAQRACLFAAALFFMAPVMANDLDSDGIADLVDNCLEVANADQRDTDGDLFGNACDPDLNNDFAVNFADLQIMQSQFFAAPDTVCASAERGNTTSRTSTLIYRVTRWWSSPESPVRANRPWPSALCLPNRNAGTLTRCPRTRVD